MTIPPEPIVLLVVPGGGPLPGREAPLNSNVLVPAPMSDQIIPQTNSNAVPKGAMLAFPCLSREWHSTLAGTDQNPIHGRDLLPSYENVADDINTTTGELWANSVGGVARQAQFITE